MGEHIANYKATDDYISLHDCLANSISFQGNTCTFVFPDGFLVYNGHESIEGLEYCYTKEGKMEITIDNPWGGGELSKSGIPNTEGDISEWDFEDYIFVQVFKENSKKEIVRQEYTIYELAEKLNRREWELEFLYRYKGYLSVIYECCIHLKEAPYYFECTLKIETDKIRFYWDEMDYERA